jgi:Uma2 family endonuclease
MTVDEFWARYADLPYELVRGEAIQVAPSGIQASVIGGNVFAALHAFVKANDLGVVTPADGGFQLTPHDLRAPDVAFITREKLQTLAEPEKFAPFAPDLAVEVVSPGNSASEIREKIDLYFAAGTRLIWIIYPDLRKVDAHSPDGTARSIGADGVLEGGELLPGLLIEVASLFPPPPDEET